MLASRSLAISCLFVGLIASNWGCAVVTRSKLNALTSQNAALMDRNWAQEARIENLEIHRRNIEDQLARAEGDVALVEEQLELERARLANYEQERGQLHAQFRGLVERGATMSPELSGRLAALSQRYRKIHFDPQTGIGKLDADVLFDIGSADLKPEAEELLRGLVEVMNTPEARDLKMMVVGHTDDRRVVKRPARDKYRDNFHLSAERALAVCSLLQRLGLEEQRVGVAGFGPHQPVAPNISGADRQKNRRVELFLLAPDVPVIGWTETIPTVY